MCHIDVLLHGVDILFQHGLLHLQAAHIDIGAHHIGDERNQHFVTRCTRGFGLIACRFNLTAIFAEQVKLPSGIEAINMPSPA